MFWLKYLQGLLNTLNENVSPSQIAAGFGLGAIIGLCPKFNLTALILWLLVFFLNVNISMATAAVVVFAIVGAVTDPLTEKLGFYLLSNVPALTPLWTTLYNTPVIPFTNFNHTLLLGNLVVGLALFLPLFFGGRRLVVVYRERYRDRVMQWRIMKVLKVFSLSDLLNRWLHR